MEESKMKETDLVEVRQKNAINSFEAFERNKDTKEEIFTNITDEKKLFNLENNVNHLLNDCEGELIRVKEVLIKRYIKDMKEPVIDEETGEVIKDKEVSMNCVLVDTNNESYATGSKIFIIQLMKYLGMKSRLGKSEEEFEIKITKKKFGKNGNKALGFELV